MANPAQFMAGVHGASFSSSSCALVFLTTFMLVTPTTSAQAGEVCDPTKKHRCEELVQDNILWKIDEPDNAASKHWQEKNLDALCACTREPYETVNCFQIEVNNHRKSWQEAIAACRANP